MPYNSLQELIVKFLGILKAGCQTELLLKIIKTYS